MGSGSFAGKSNSTLAPSGSWQNNLPDFQPSQAVQIQTEYRAVLGRQPRLQIGCRKFYVIDYTGCVATAWACPP
ncbi:MAG: hypothetical protein IPI17_16980 [Nitrosomonas sp.]|nr:hypothetical protein [Nitrosomonas sp.]